MAFDEKYLVEDFIKRKWLFTRAYKDNLYKALEIAISI